MPDTTTPRRVELPPMRVASCWTFAETPARAFALLRQWADRHGLPPGWQPRFFGFPNPDPFGPGFEAWMAIPDDLPVAEDAIVPRQFPGGLEYAVVPPAWEGDGEAWVMANTLGFGLHQGFHEYRFGGRKTDPERAEKWWYLPVAKEPLPGELDLVEMHAMRLAAVALPDLDAFLSWFHDFVGRHPAAQRPAIQLYQAPGDGFYDAWVVPSSTSLLPEGAGTVEFEGGKYARVTTSEVKLPGDIGKGWGLVSAHGHEYDGSRRFLLQPHRHRNDICRKAMIWIHYPVK